MTQTVPGSECFLFLFWKSWESYAHVDLWLCEYHVYLNIFPVCEGRDAAVVRVEHAYMVSVMPYLELERSEGKVFQRHDLIWGSDVPFLRL